VRAAAAVYLLGPQIPMIFMGEEWAAAQPFPFFCNFEPELAAAVREGRRAEFAKFPEFQDAEQRERIPDLAGRETFLSAKLNWDDRNEHPHAGWLHWYQRVLAARHAQIVPRLSGACTGGRYEVLEEMAVRVGWLLPDGSELVLLANLKATLSATVNFPKGHTVWLEGMAADGKLGPWSVLWTIRDSAHGA
jgi:1,4-alpha-glucan branching enzyme